MYHQVMQENFKDIVKWFGVASGPCQIEQGDFLMDDIQTRINEADVIFVNNFAFGPTLNESLKVCLSSGHAA
jgi:H3 lysine-79-specific histone-lysine N-methyltransferase